MVKRVLSYAVGMTLAICYFLAYQGILSHVIAYHEQHHLFLFSKAYFLHQLQTVGLIGYLTDFLIQFFYYPGLGSLLLTCLLVACYALTRYLLHRLSGKEDFLFLAVLPSLALFFYTMSADHELTLVVGSVLSLSLLSLILCLWRSRTPLLPFCAKLHLPLLRGRGRMLLTVAFLVGYGALGYSYFVQHYNRKEGIMLKTEQHVKHKEWHAVLDYTERYLQGGKTNQLMAYFRSLALYHTGELPYRLFDYPATLGVKTLYLPWNSNSRESEYGHFVYEELGHINEAHRWEFEAMVVWGETAPHLLNLARYNIVNHRPRVAQRFLNKLKQSLFYRQQALELEKRLESGQVDGLRKALDDDEASPARFSNVLNLGPELEYLCDQDPTNKMAFEYLMSYLLLSNNVQRFADNIHRIRRFHYPSLPPLYEEALYIYRLKVGEERFRQLGFELSPSTSERFDRYYALMKSGQTALLRSQFGGSYWFYLNYLSPYGNKAIDN